MGARSVLAERKNICSVPSSGRFSVYGLTVDIADRLTENRRAFDRDSRGKWWHGFLSAGTYQIDRAVRTRLLSVAKGRLLDVGCGSMPYRELDGAAVDHYTSLDIEPRVPGVDIVADIQAMPQVESRSFDTILCSEVLEHVARPCSAAAELARVMRPGGFVVVTAPHLSRVHEAPNDYHRFTKYGLIELATSAGLEVIEATEVGSAFSFLAHQLSAALILPIWHIPVVKWIALVLASTIFTLPALALDRVPGVRRILPLAHVMVARRPVV